VSGSDDRTVGLWSLEKSYFAGEAEVRAVTVHSHNIFDACFSPNQASIVATCGADGRVGLVDAGRPGGPGPPQIIYGRQNYSPFYSGAIASKMSFISPECFLVAFYDGKLRALDVRQAPTQNSACVALDLQGNGCCSVEVRPSQPYVFALGTDDSAIRICDLRTANSKDRSVQSSWQKEDNNSEDSSDAMSFYQDDDSNHDESSSSMSCSCADDDDNNDDDNDDNEHCWSGSDWLAGFAVRARLRVLDIPIIENDTDVGISGVAWNPNNDTKLAANFRGDDVFVFNVSPSAHKLSSPLRFRGRDNIATCAKEVRWLFGGTCLATGGDDGCLYIWRASDAAPLIKVRADRNVVNSLAPHPNLPLLVTSGIDSEIKLFEATAPAVSLSTHAGFNKSGISQDAANAPLSPIARQCSTVPLVTPEACPLFADRQAVDSDSSRSVCDSEDDSLDPGDWERRLSERPPSITAAHARSILSKATSLREHADSYARRGAHTAAARSYDAALALTRFSPPSLSTAAERASLRNSCDIAAARQHIIEHEYDAALRLLRKIQTRSEGLLPYLSPDFYRLYALVTPTLDATTTIPSETDSNHVEEIPALIQPLPTLEEVDHMITNCAEGPFASSAAC